MAEDPEEVYRRVLEEEQQKGSSPAVAEARAKAARVRAQRGLPIDPQAAATAAKEPSEKPPEKEAEQPAEAAGEAPAPAGDGKAAEGDGQAAPAEKEPAEKVAAAAPRGRGAAARARRTDEAGAVPERIQRLLAVVKPEAIQRVEREPIDRVNVWPHLMSAEFVSLLVVSVFLMVFSVFIDAPFRELANINQTPNPSKAPWYFLGLQEMLRYFHPQIAGVAIPQWIIFAFAAAPYIDRNPSTKPEDRKVAIVLFTFYIIYFAVLTIIGSLFRGPGFNWVYPWEIEIVRIFEF